MPVATNGFGVATNGFGAVTAILLQIVACIIFWYLFKPNSFDDNKKL